jgi:hypothetical protein
MAPMPNWVANRSSDTSARVPDYATNKILAATVALVSTVSSPFAFICFGAWFLVHAGIRF